VLAEIGICAREGRGGGHGEGEERYGDGVRDSREQGHGISI
jgi:hypothetical protein